MKRIASFTLLVLPFTINSVAQSNEGGTFHIGLGWSLGIHSTHYEQQYTIAGYTTNNDDDGAAITRSFLIDLQIGVAKPMSIGIYVEPGNYLDSSATRKNRFIIAGIAPRIYIINKDRFNWMAGPEVGVSALQIEDAEYFGKTYTDSYLGIHVRIATGVAFYFGDHFGIQTQVKYAIHSMPWRDRDPESTLLDDANFDATLSTSGVQFQLGATVKF
ncbi:MAG: hypothetical protein WAU70_09415 [Flavobacteriales bacterium]